MGLEDKFYPDGDAITKLDNATIWCAGKFGEAYQHLTGRSYTDLENSLRGLSFSLAGVSALTGQVAGIILLGTSSLSMVNRVYETPIEEVNRWETTYGTTGHTPKRVRMFQILLGATIIGGYASGIFPLREKNQTLEFQAGGVFVGGCFLTNELADAMTKANIPKPPSKTVFRRAYDKTKRLVRIPIPIPVRLGVALEEKTYSNTAYV
jgi:hypothetical protein